MRAFVQRTVDACEQALKAMNELDEILETGFGNREVRRVTEMIEVLEDIEHDTDRIQIEVRRTLFKIEKTLHPVDVMFMYTIIEWIGDVADRAERVGNRLEQLLAR
jgi:predicted phosphate transport protein (TIGR00153 family)